MRITRQQLRQILVQEVTSRVKANKLRTMQPTSATSRSSSKKKKSGGGSDSDDKYLEGELSSGQNYVYEKEENTSLNNPVLKIDRTLIVGDDRGTRVAVGYDSSNPNQDPTYLVMRTSLADDVSIEEFTNACKSSNISIEDVLEAIEKVGMPVSTAALESARDNSVKETVKITKRQLRTLIESVLNESIDEAHNAALKEFGLPNDHPIGELRDDIIVLHQEVESTVENASQFAKYDAADMGLKAQFFRAKKYMHPNPIEPEHIYFKIVK